MNKLKIAVSGIGGVGGYYGGLLAAHYQHSEDIDIYFVSRGKNLKAIQENGLQVKTPQKMIVAHPKRITDNPADIGKVDFLFCCTKAYDLEDNIRQLKPAIGTETVVIPLLNGVDIADRIQRILPDAYVWEGCSYIVSALEVPGVIDKTSPKDFLYFGSKNGDKMRQRLLLSLLEDAGIAAFNPEDMEQRTWMKYAMISTTATITSFYNLPIGKIVKHHFDEYIALVEEVRNVAVAKGIRLADDIVDSCAEAQRLMPEDSTTSMHRDFMQGGSNELETLTGYVVKAASELNVEVPLYNKMYNHLKGLNR